MKEKFDSPSFNSFEDPEFERLVCLSGALVPIAHIKIIGEVEYGIASVEEGDGSRTPL